MLQSCRCFSNISTLNAKLGVSKPMIQHHHDTKTCSGPGNAAFLSAFSTKVIAVQLWMTGSIWVNARTRWPQRWSVRANARTRWLHPCSVVPTLAQRASLGSSISCPCYGRSGVRPHLSTTATAASAVRPQSTPQHDRHSSTNTTMEYPPLVHCCCTF